MDDQLDNDLKKRIREVFDNYNDEHADEGWLLLREKYPEKARRRPVVWLWWSSAAAVLLLFLGILLYNNASKKENKLVVNKPGISHPILKSIEPQKNNNVNNSKNKDNNNAAADSVINSLQTQTLADNQLPSNRSHKSNVAKINRQSLIADKSNKIANSNNISDKPAIANSELPVKDNSAQSIAAVNLSKEPAKQPVTVTGADNTAKGDSGINITTKSIAATTQPNGINTQDQAKNPNKTLFADNEVPKIKKNKNSGYMGPRVRLGIYAASYVNYAKGSNNQVNAGLGISSDIRLSKKFNLSTGVAIVQNSLNFGSQLPPETAKLNASSALTSPSAHALTAVAYSQNSFFAATPSLKNYNANLVGLDIPVNLKYQFNPEKSAAFVSIGVSSGTFVNETYTSTYKYVTPFASNLSQTTDQSFRQSFNGFYFAKTLNFSFGTGYRIAGNDIIIEPFLKYPLEGLGSQQIKFGSGGVNLKFSFPTKRK
jgi:hypothetical protein